MKRYKYLAVATLMFGVFSSVAEASMQDVTLLLVPREEGTVRIGMDVGNRYPTLLLSYKVLPNGSVSLHGWSGSEWVNVVPDAYEDGTFFKNGPSSALIIETDGRQVPESLIPSEEWCPSVYTISTKETRPLLHLIGRHYDFNFKDWKWFSSNYHLALNSINPDGLNIAWYHRNLRGNIEKKQSEGASDLQYLAVVRRPEVVVSSVVLQGPVVQEPVVDGVETDASATNEVPEAIGNNPLTNTVPDAVILGASNAAESAEAADESVAIDEEATGEEE